MNAVLPLFLLRNESSKVATIAWECSQVDGWRLARAPGCDYNTVERGNSQLRGGDVLLLACYRDGRRAKLIKLEMGSASWSL